MKSKCIALVCVGIIFIAIAMRLQSAPATAEKFSASRQAAAQPTIQPNQSEIDSANKLFETGKFAEAGKIYMKIVAKNPKDYSAILQLGRIALLSNRLDDAQKWLEKAITLQPGETDPKAMLAQVFYRRDDFQKAAAALKGVDVSSNKLIREQYPTLDIALLESFKGQTPYQLQDNGTSTHVKFWKTKVIATDPEIV